MTEKDDVAAAMDQVSQRVVLDDIEAVVASYIDEHDLSGVTTQEIVYVIEAERVSFKGNLNWRVGRCLNRLGWKRTNWRVPTSMTPKSCGDRPHLYVPADKVNLVNSGTLRYAKTLKLSSSFNLR